jgi:ribonuclease T1
MRRHLCFLLVATLAAIIICSSIATNCVPVSLYPDENSAKPGYELSQNAINLGEIVVHDLPGEARDTLKLIKNGGPYPYKQDGMVFSNREKLLPGKTQGYYHEYTVKTPGAQDRGARRIIAGDGGELYYTDDHYRTFKRIRE